MWYRSSTVKKVGKQRLAKGIAAIFTKTCFDPTVGVWPARKGKKTRFLIDFLAFFSTDLIAHNPEVVGSSPASATKKDSHPFGWLSFFLRGGLEPI